MTESTTVLSLLIAAGVPLITAIYLYGRMSKQVDSMEEENKKTSDNHNKDTEALRIAISSLEVKIDNKKLDKEVFEQFARRMEENADTNNRDHQAICTKLDKITDILIKD